MGYGPCKMVSFDQKSKMPKKVRNKNVQAHWSCCVLKAAPKTIKYSQNESILKMAKIGHHAWAVKWSVWVKNLKCQKDAKNVRTTKLELLCARNRSKKRITLKKWDHFEMDNIGRDSWTVDHAKWSLWVKNKNAKTVRKSLYDRIRVVVRKKTLQKTPNIKRMREFWKWPK